MGRQGDTEWQSQEDQRRKLNQAGPTPGEGRKQIRDQGNEKEDELIGRLQDQAYLIYYAR